MRARGAWATTRARGAEAQYLVAGADMLRDGEGASTDGKGERETDPDRWVPPVRTFRFSSFYWSVRNLPKIKQSLNRIVVYCTEIQPTAHLTEISSERTSECTV
jgi:hypothetical protein